MERLFSEINPKCVVEIEHYSVFCLICNEILKRCDIPIIELQHGQIGSGHIAYNGIASGYERCLPTEIATFGAFWGDQCVVPDGSVIFSAVGSVPLEHGPFRKSGSVRPSVCKASLLVVCQGNDGGAIDEFVSSILRDSRADAWEIVVKMHPSEVNSWRITHPRLAVEKNRVSIATEGAIGDYLSNCDAVVGISSTALFEAVAYDKPVFVLETIDSEIAEPLVEIGAAVSIKNGHDFLDAYADRKKFSSSLKGYIWKGGAAENVCELIESYCK